MHDHKKTFKEKFQSSDFKSLVNDFFKTYQATGNFDITPITDYVEKSLSLNIQQFRNRLEIEAVFTSIAKECQELENVFIDLKEKFILETAVGDQLDITGIIVGQPRNGLDDNDYRDAIYTKILVNKSWGQTEILIQAAQILSGQNPTFLSYRNLFPAAFYMAMENIDDPNAVKIILDRVKAAGVGYFVTYWNFDPVFQYDASGSIGIEKNIVDENENFIVDQSGNFLVSDPISSGSAGFDFGRYAGGFSS